MLARPGFKKLKSNGSPGLALDSHRPGADSVATDEVTATEPLQAIVAGAMKVASSQAALRAMVPSGKNHDSSRDVDDKDDDQDNDEQTRCGEFATSPS